MYQFIKKQTSLETDVSHRAGAQKEMSYKRRNSGSGLIFLILLLGLPLYLISTYPVISIVVVSIVFVAVICFAIFYRHELEAEKSRKVEAERLEAERLRRSRITEVDSMTGIEFEKYLASIFQGLGYSVKLTQASNDYGADLILFRDSVKTVVQAKRYSKPVSNKAVQEVFSAKGYYDADEAWVVTNASYTSNAHNTAAKLGVKLIARTRLIELASQITSCDDDKSEQVCLEDLRKQVLLIDQNDYELFNFN